MAPVYIIVLCHLDVGILTASNSDVDQKRSTQLIVGKKYEQDRGKK
jgi:hypothetical protein